MKHLVSAVVLGLAGAAGCVEPPRPEVTSTAGMSFEEYRAAAARHREPGTGAYIVDGDIALHGDDALYRHWQEAQQGALTIYSLDGIDQKWSDTQKLNLTYCISDTFGAQKAAMVAAMNQATTNGWGKFANLKFIHVTAQDATCTATNANVLFDVRPINSGGQYLARAFFPGFPRSERNILVDPASFNAGWPLANILAHELGHVLGFRHEHVRAPGDPCPEGVDFRAITTYDAASVMHYPQCGGTSQDLAFTQLDRDGAAIVYGQPVVNLPPMAMINAPVNGATVLPTFSVETSIIDTDLLRAELFIDGVLYRTLTAAPFTFQVTDLTEGLHTLQIRALDQIQQSTQRQIQVTVQKPAPMPDPGPGSGSGSGSGSNEDPDTGGDGGGCSTGGGSAGAGLLVALGLLAARRRPRRR